MKASIQTQLLANNEGEIMDRDGMVCKTISCSEKHIALPRGAQVKVFIPYPSKKEGFAERWGRCVDRLGARRGTVQELLSI